MPSPHIRAIDLFCGAGGSSWGARLAGARIVAGFDMCVLAGKVYKRNFPEARFYRGRLENRSVKQVGKELGRVDLLLASPECTNHSTAKGNKERCELSKATAFQVARFARAFEPRWIVIENVVNMRSWSRYEELREKLAKLGYNISDQVLNAADFGVPQNRRRLFLLCDRKRNPPTIIGNGKRPKAAKRVVNQNGMYRYSPLRDKSRALATIERAERAISEVGRDKPFLLVYYGSDAAGGWQRLERPLRTVTTLDRFALVKPTKTDHEMRMLQVPELKAAMGMPKRFQINQGTRRDRIRLVGNAVCPPVMESVVRRILRSRG